MDNNRRHAHVVNIDELEPREVKQGGFEQRARRLGAAAGGKGLGCSHYELPPGKTAFPYHYHSAIEEALYVLEGRGELRVGKDRVPVRAGDYVGLPPGPDCTHALTNTGDTTLRYLCLSGPATHVSLDIVGYPDSAKIAFAAGVPPGGTLRDGWIMKVIKEDQPPVGYYDGEPLAEQK